MCIIAFAQNVHPDYPFILIGNRDEFYERPTKVAHWWTPDVLAGKDLEAGGTWLGISRLGKIATVTNYRDIKGIKTMAKSRGEIPINFLQKNHSQDQYHKELLVHGDQYNGYNLLTWQGGQSYHSSNYQSKISEVNDGIHVLSNALLDTPWYKSERLRTTFSQALEKEIKADTLLQLLTNESKSPDKLLPETGLEYHQEKAISSIFINSPGYGTCSSTVLLVNTKNEVTFIEKIYPVGNRKSALNSFNFNFS